MILCHNTASVFAPKSISDVQAQSQLEAVMVEPVKINIQHQRASGSISSNMDPPLSSVLWEALLCADLLNIDKSVDTPRMLTKETTSQAYVRNNDKV